MKKINAKDLKSENTFNEATTINGSIPANTKITVKGNLIVNGSVGEHAEIIIDMPVAQGKTYLNGKRIFKDGNDNVGLLSIQGSVEGAKIKCPDDITITGYVGDNSHISVQGNLTTNDIGKKVTIEATQGTVKCGDIGKSSVIKLTSGAVHAGNVDEQAYIFSTSGNLNVKHVGAYSTVKTNSGSITYESKEEAAEVISITGRAICNGARQASSTLQMMNMFANMNPVTQSNTIVHCQTFGDQSVAYNPGTITFTDEGFSSDNVNKPMKPNIKTEQKAKYKSIYLTGSFTDSPIAFSDKEEGVHQTVVYKR